MESAEWKIFISYSHADVHIVKPLTELIRVTGVPAFRDEDSIPKGKRWQMVISDSIAACKTLIVFWSFAASRSDAVASEYNAAIELKKDVVPVLIDATPMNDKLSAYQWIDLREIIFRPSEKEQILKTKLEVGARIGAGAAIGAVFGGPVGAILGGAVGYLVPLLFSHEQHLFLPTEIVLSDAQKQSFMAALEARLMKGA